MVPRAYTSTLHVARYNASHDSMIKLELYRAHTPRALQRRCQSISMVRELESSLLTTFTDILCQVVRMSREHIVGSVRRRGQQNAAFATLVGLAKQFEA